ncbi:hypothetical protein U2F26_31915 [Micromonospora sp. 4G57]|uniref:Uncharacterized protein n=1 Tax=Micromonospora sicca TaxID=2202420 RepID=A0ABU5JMU8_9ACTN|nr:MULTISPECIES: hypothetical protein [unclassified Micromonospora]MDZ5447263.1 hypothetical protein [Micromonospora sp. 4G57]MDZ5493959.1 hypothetical protein [Micromonospora sp. 4G53]
MSCSTLIGITASGGAYIARWLHWGGDPAEMLPLLRRVWQQTFDRHTLAMVEAVVGHDWVAIDAAAAGSGRRRVGRPVPGVGYTADLTGGVRRGRIDDPAEGYLEWMYLVDVSTDSVVVYEATCHGRWLRHSRHLLDPNSAGMALGCGGHTVHGHHWAAAHLWLPEARAGLDAEICLAAHPHGAPVIKIGDPVAHAIAATTAARAAGSGRQGLWLRPAAAEFDLMLPGRHGALPHRLRRDTDGLLLLDVPLPDWSWRLSGPAEGERR